MAAARFALGSFCRGGATFQNSWLAARIGLFAFGLLACDAAHGNVRRAPAVSARIQAQRLEQANAELQHQATHDALTGLPNRVLFLDRLEREIAHAERDGHTFAVLAVDLDRFKVINDTLGHGRGDEMLKEIAGRLSASIRNVDTVARTGGDEFLLLSPIFASRADASGGRQARLLPNSINPSSCGGAEVHTSASIGISVYPTDGRDSDSLVAHADEAMYFAKQHGRNTFQFFSARHERLLRERLELGARPAPCACR